jgi:cell division protein FtsN
MLSVENYANVSLNQSGAAQQSHQPDSALRASADGRSEPKWFLSCGWFQSDRRAERVRRAQTGPINDVPTEAQG